MAVTETNYFNNAIVGQLMVGGDIDVLRIDTTPKFAVGTGFTRSDGNCYRYVHFGAASNIGLAVSTDLSESCLVSQSNLVTPASATKAGGETMYPGQVGSHYIEVKGTMTNNQYAGGYFHIVDSTGVGACYRIKGHGLSLTNSTTTGNFQINIYESVKLALTSASEYCIFGSLYANVEPGDSTTDYSAVGITCGYGASASTYGWILTRGIGTGYNPGATTVGAPITVNTGGILASVAIGSVTSSVLNVYGVGLAVGPTASAVKVWFE